MREFPYKTWLLAGVFLLMPWVAQAAGLGKLTILSALGQPLSAEIDLMSVQKDELSTLTVRIAAPEAFQQANIQYSPALIGMRLSIERRADGKPYIKIISTRAVNEPFIDLLVELSWAQGRLVREYTALIDPPGYTPIAPIAPAAPPVAITPPTVPESTPVETAPQPLAGAPVGTKPTAEAPAAAAAPRPAAAPTKAERTEYGVKRGDTLSKIAAGVKPEGVTLEQMLVSLYRTNPDAFVGNMNRLKTGKILRVPEKEQIETSQPAAVKEVRVQAANWNAYRRKLAEAAGETPAQETKSTASGKIATAVEDKAAGKDAPKEVLKLSKGEPAAPGKAGSGKPLSARERVRMLEEEATAREKALAEANDRVVQLEKTIKDMQRLLEIKGQVPGAPAVKPAAPQPAPGAKPEPMPPAKADQVAKADAAKAQPAKAEPAKAEPAKAEPAKVEPAKAEPAKADAVKMEPAKDAAKAPEQPKPKPKPKVVAPPPSPGLMEQIIGEPLYLAAGGGLLVLLGGGGYWFVRRRRVQAAGAGPAEKTAPVLGGKAAAATTMAVPMMTTAPAAAGDDVDPLAEADLYLNFGRDAQAEEVLKEALEKNPKHEEAQLKLLQIYAGRKDKAGFEKVARNLNTQTGGAGDNWLKAAAMGYAFDPGNALYAAGKSAPVAAMPIAGGAAAGPDLDFDLELSSQAGGTKTDVELDAGAANKTVIMQPGVLAGMAAPQDTTATQDITADSGAARAAPVPAAAAPDFTLNVPAAGAAPAEPDITLDAPGSDVAKTNVAGGAAAPMASVIDFNFDAAAPAPAAPAAEGKGMTHDGTVIISPQNQDKAAGLSMDFELSSTAKIPSAKPADAATTTGSMAPLAPDFKLDLGDTAGAAAPLAPELKLDDINLRLDEAPKAGAPQAEGGAKDDHWYDVQTKFDLAKAYQEMGDKDGAREILQEVIKDGDAGQQAEAKKLLESLG